MDAFQSARTFTLAQERGFVCNPADHGGATNYGITQITYDRYRRAMHELNQSVELISVSEVTDIYAGWYWVPAHCAGMPIRLAVAHFDWAVNHGVTGAIETLQDVLGVESDGLFGPETRAELQHQCTADLEALIGQYLDARRTWYRTDVAHDATQEEFLADWLRRVDELEAYIAGLS